MSADYDFDLGTVSFPVTTRSDEAQRWFDRGLVWCYAFAHEEAVRCFRRAAEHDPECAMAWWGVGYAAGPYYNKPWEKFDPADLERTLGTVRDAALRALDRVTGVAPIERALVEALAPALSVIRARRLRPLERRLRRRDARGVRSHPDDPT